MLDEINKPAPTIIIAAIITPTIDFLFNKIILVCQDINMPRFNMKLLISCLKTDFVINKKILLCLVFLVLIGVKCAYAAEPIMITYSQDMNKVIFDGKWSFFGEWKRTSLNTLSYNDGTVIQLRTAHQDNFIYVFIDEISETILEKGSDRATICFDSKNTANPIINENDYCFMTTLGGINPLVLQGGSIDGINGNFKRITAPSDFIGIGGVSDNNDRYSAIPHAGYEFRIPTDLVGRSDIYNFYVGVYDAHSNKIYSWPQNATTDSPLKIPSKSLWGQIVSPDESLPEFQPPIIVLLIAFFLLIYLTRYRYHSIIST